MWWRTIVVLAAMGWVLAACGVAGDYCEIDADCLSGRCLEVRCDNGDLTRACTGADCTASNTCALGEICLGTVVGGAYCMPDNVC